MYGDITQSLLLCLQPAKINRIQRTVNELRMRNRKPLKARPVTVFIITGLV